MYEECRKLYTEELNAAAKGAKRAGATEIVMVDCHGAGGDWSFNSLVPELIDPDDIRNKFNLRRLVFCS
jgi:D-amino peptidase